MLLFPIISGITLLILFASFIAPLYIFDSYNWANKFLSKNEEIVNFLLIFIFYYITYFVMIFFNAALIASAKIRIDGGDPTVRGGLKVAISHLFHIAGWALISSSVGMLLRIVEESFEFVGKIVSSVLGIAWSITSFLVIPILVIEKKAPSTAFKESAKLLKKTWGEQVIGNFSFGLVFLALSLPAWLLISVVVFSAQGMVSTVLITVTVIYIILLIIIQMALQAIFQTVLYQYARFNRVSGGFSNELLRSSITTK
jgi:hypothetical protein